MLVKDSNRLSEFRAADGCLVREVIHPRNDGTTPEVSLARATLGPGEATRPHCLEMVEICFLLAGRGRMVVDGRTRDVAAGQAVYVPAGSVQHIANIGPDDLDFLCVCAPAYDPARDHPA
ncbi:MAG: cupin domain-containing protein [Proteobacteria bacterium]|nr:cupin domain-containing protein [Pseudomonadota bacterium]MBU1742687.1 cupin domain-containing protein [Pseudomonadota bacterium]